MPNPLKKGMDTPVEITVVREVQCYVIITDLAISLVLKPKKFDFVHQTISRQEASIGWVQDYTRICHDVPIT